MIDRRTKTLAFSALVLATSLGSLAAQARLLRDLHPTGSASPSGFVQAGTSLFFSANDAQGRHLYRLTGTRVERMGTTASSPRDIVAFGSHVIFSASTRSHGRELWISNGTAVGTRMIRDIFRGSLSSDPKDLCVVGNRVYFSAADGARGTELWSTSGTFASTDIVRDIVPGLGSSAPQQLNALGTTVVFSAFRSDSGREPFVSDGTSAGTRLLIDIRKGRTSSNPRHMKTLLNHVYFGATNPNGEFAFFRTNGRNFTRQTSAAKPMAPLFVTGTVGLLPMGTVASGEALHLQVGTFLAAPKLVRNLGQLAASPRDFVETKAGSIFFSAFRSEHGRELYFTNTTSTGTKLVKDVRPGPQGGMPVPQQGLSRMAAIDSSRVVFAGTDASGDLELWISDGSDDGTYRAQDINPTGSSNPQEFIRYGRDVIFVANDGVHGFELYRVTPGSIVGGSAVSYGKGCKGSGKAHNTCFSKNTSAQGAAASKEDTIYAIEIAPRTENLLIAGYEIRTNRVRGAATGTMRGTLMLPRLGGKIPAVEHAVGHVVLDGASRFHRITFDKPVLIPAGVRFFLTVDASEAALPIARSGNVSRRFTQKKGSKVWLAAGTSPFIFKIVCASFSTAVPLHTSTKATQGNRYTATLTRAAPRSAALFFVGFSDRNLGALPLPIDLGFFGAPGCSLLSSSELSFPVPTDGIGEGSMAFSIVPKLQLIGLRFYSQFLVIDPKANSRGLVLSNAMRTVVGR